MLATRTQPGFFFTPPALIKFPGSPFSDYLARLSEGFMYSGAHVGDPAARGIGVPPAEKYAPPADVGWGTLEEHIEPVRIVELLPTLHVREGARCAHGGAWRRRGVTSAARGARRREM